MHTSDSFVHVNGQVFYKVEQSQWLAPFFINVVSACDVWIFMSSKGGITAGRKDAQGAVFPYETDDRLHDQAHTGSKTIVRINNQLWEPFARTSLQKFSVTQNIYKAVQGTSVIFEEINEELELSFAYQYESSEFFGVVKTATLKNLSGKTVQADILDGLENIMPCYVDKNLQATSSTLVDAYKANELCPNSVLATYALTTLINDTPNPMEILRANVAWTDCTKARIALSSQAVEAFVNDTPYPYGESTYGCKGAYFVNYREELIPGGGCTHRIVVDHGYDHCALIELKELLSAPIDEALQSDIQKGREQLSRYVAMADGVQHTADQTAVHHHYLNTLYNVLRGGIFADAYALDTEDFLDFALVRSRNIGSDKQFTEKVKQCQTIHELKAALASDPQALRLALEYLPLSFSRRHGDPSRPWNQFQIKLKDDQGKPVKRYEGNWRDIFQNWEALGLSFPCYYEHMIAIFVNASTVDGFNPYRIHRDGIDWERPEPNNPFSGLGYWGDHQIIYLLRLLKGLHSHFPGRLRALLRTEVFSYANVPYILKPYEEIEANSKHTVVFDRQRDHEIAALCQAMGTDGQLVLKDSSVYCVGLMEKLIVPLLGKMANMHLDGGVWMNTQRPEWNDANNAIVGIGLSMVTVYHMRAYVQFLLEIVKEEKDGFTISKEVADWLQVSLDLMQSYRTQPMGSAKQLLDQMGKAFSDYRQNVYQNGFSQSQPLDASTVRQWLDLCASLLDGTIRENRNTLFATYNLLHGDGTVEPMRFMLEGQSAAIGAGLVDTGDIQTLLCEMDKVLGSERHGAHFLYPKHMTVPFFQKNSFTAPLAADGTIVCKDQNGMLHFGAALTTQNALQKTLETSAYNKEQRQFLLEKYESMFGHQRFTGRSQVMYKYEGIGCIYWHQNAKLALAILELAIANRYDRLKALKAYKTYRDVTRNFLYRKDSTACQAIPIEPYSHSSFDGKSQQPGMTGQVKESVLMRRGELGIIVENGCLQFDTWFVSPDEFDEMGCLSFSVCGVPVRYMPGEKKDGYMNIHYAGKEKECLQGYTLPESISQAIFFRQNDITGIDVKYCGANK
jgi:hypothetical protein